MAKPIITQSEYFEYFHATRNLEHILEHGVTGVIKTRNGTLIVSEKSWISRKLQYLWELIQSLWSKQMQHRIQRRTDAKMEIVSKSVASINDLRSKTLRANFSGGDKLGNDYYIRRAVRLHNKSITLLERWQKTLQGETEKHPVPHIIVRKFFDRLSGHEIFKKEKPFRIRKRIEKIKIGALHNKSSKWFVKLCKKKDINLIDALKNAEQVPDLVALEDGVEAYSLSKPDVKESEKVFSTFLDVAKKSDGGYVDHLLRFVKSTVHHLDLKPSTIASKVVSKVLKPSCEKEKIDVVDFTKWIKEVVETFPEGEDQTAAKEHLTQAAEKFLLKQNPQKGKVLSSVLIQAFRKQCEEKQWEGVDQESLKGWVGHVMTIAQEEENKAAIQEALLDFLVEFALNASGFGPICRALAYTVGASSKNKGDIDERFQSV